MALVYEGESLTYAELNARANRLGHRLRSSGVGPDVLVGLFMECSPEMVIGLLATLKAGGAYVPLDPDYPAERLAMMLDDAQPAVVLTQAHLEKRFPDVLTPVLCVDREIGERARGDLANPVAGVLPHSLAYVIYTSGSTGTPKGAMNTHAGICNRLLWGQDTYGLRSDDRVLQKTPFSFDVSVWEFFWPLIAGARLVLARPGGHRDPLYLRRLIQDAGVTVVHFVPSMLQVFLDERDLEQCCRTLRHVFTSGEALPEQVARRCLSRLACRLHNLYGPTEASVEATYWECRPGDPPGPVPIGKPIANMKTYVLDPRLHPLPVGVAGELYLGGIGVARGYLNRPELTAERFLFDPFDSRPEARMYRTGDKVRWRRDGNIEFLGRMDDQIKLWGLRIEPGEIETALCRHSAIRQAVVEAREDRPDDQRLVAYLVTAGESPELDDKALRAFLARSLPEYLIPSAFVRLRSFPLNANGKLDRLALPAPRQDGSDRETGYVAPRDELEELLASVWRDVLGAARVGIHDDFFHLGGHSVLAAKATARASELLGIEIPPSRLFGNRTIEGLAREVSRLRLGENGRCVRAPASFAGRTDGPLPLSFAQQRLWFLDQLEDGLAAYNIPTANLVRGELDVESLRGAIEAIIARHEPLRTTFDAQDGWPSQHIHSPSRFELPVADLRDFAPESRASIAAERMRLEGDRPFNLARDLPIRALLLRLAGDEFILLVTIHHIATDGWSMTIFWRELAALYNARVRGEPAVLGELPVRYAEYAVWQRALLDEERLEQLVAFWRKRLDGLLDLDIPADRPRQHHSYRGATHRFALPPGLVNAARELARDAGATLNMVLQGAFQLLLARYCDHEDIAVGVPAAGRGRSDLEGLIGFFVNTLVVRVDLSGNPSFRQVLDRVRQSSLEAFDHQDLPFEQLVEHVRPREARARARWCARSFSSWISGRRSRIWRD